MSQARVSVGGSEDMAQEILLEHGGDSTYGVVKADQVISAWKSCVGIRSKKGQFYKPIPKQDQFYDEMKARGFLVLQKNGTPHDTKQLWTFGRRLNERAEALKKSKGTPSGKVALADFLATQFPTLMCLEKTKPPPSNLQPRDETQSTEESNTNPARISLSPKFRMRSAKYRFSNCTSFVAGPSKRGTNEFSTELENNSPKRSTSFISFESSSDEEEVSSLIEVSSRVQRPAQKLGVKPTKTKYNSTTWGRAMAYAKQTRREMSRSRVTSAAYSRIKTEHETSIQEYKLKCQKLEENEADMHAKMSQLEDTLSELNRLLIQKKEEITTLRMREVTTLRMREDQREATHVPQLPELGVPIGLGKRGVGGSITTEEKLTLLRMLVAGAPTSAMIPVIHAMLYHQKANLKKPLPAKEYYQKLRRALYPLNFISEKLVLIMAK